MTATPNAPGSWIDKAACKGKVKTFYANPNHKTEIGRALALCKVCPVVTECGQYALDNNEEYGVWGGMTPQQRRDEIPAKPKRALTVSCGTNSGYVKGCRCVPCMVAHAIAVSEYRKGKRATRSLSHPVGTVPVPPESTGTVHDLPHGEHGQKAGLPSENSERGPRV